MINKVLNSIWPLKIFINYILEKTCGEYITNKIDFKNLNINLENGASFSIFDIILNISNINRKFFGNNKLAVSCIKLAEGRIGRLNITYNKNNHMFCIKIDDVFLNFTTNQPEDYKKNKSKIFNSTSITNENSSSNFTDNLILDPLELNNDTTRNKEKSIISNLLNSFFSNINIEISNIIVKVNYFEIERYILNNPSFIICIIDIKYNKNKDNEELNTTKESNTNLNINNNNENFNDTEYKNEIIINETDDIQIDDNDILDVIENTNNNNLYLNNNKFYNHSTVTVKTFFVKLNKDSNFDYKNYFVKLNECKTNYLLMINLECDNSTILSIGIDDILALKLTINEETINKTNTKYKKEQLYLSLSIGQIEILFNSLQIKYLLIFSEIIKLYTSTLPNLKDYCDNQFKNKNNNHNLLVENTDYISTVKEKYFNINIKLILVSLLRSNSNNNIPKMFLKYHNYFTYCDTKYSSLCNSNVIMDNTYIINAFSYFEDDMLCLIIRDLCIENNNRQINIGSIELTLSEYEKKTKIDKLNNISDKNNISINKMMPKFCNISKYNDSMLSFIKNSSNISDKSSEYESFSINDNNNTNSSNNYNNQNNNYNKVFESALEEDAIYFNKYKEYLIDYKYYSIIHSIICIENLAINNLCTKEIKEYSNEDNNHLKKNKDIYKKYSKLLELNVHNKSKKELNNIKSNNKFIDIKINSITLNFNYIYLLEIFKFINNIEPYKQLLNLTDIDVKHKIIDKNIFVPSNESNHKCSINNFNSSINKNYNKSLLFNINICETIIVINTLNNYRLQEYLLNYYNYYINNKYVRNQIDYYLIKEYSVLKILNSQAIYSSYISYKDKVDEDVIKINFGDLKAYYLNSNKYNSLNDKNLIFEIITSNNIIKNYNFDTKYKINININNKNHEIKISTYIDSFNFYIIIDECIDYSLTNQKEIYSGYQKTKAQFKNNTLAFLNSFSNYSMPSMFFNVFNEKLSDNEILFKESYLSYFINYSYKIFNKEYNKINSNYSLLFNLFVKNFDSKIISFTNIHNKKTTVLLFSIKNNHITADACNGIISYINITINLISLSINDNLFYKDSQSVNLSINKENNNSCNFNILASFIPCDNNNLKPNDKTINKSNYTTKNVLNDTFACSIIDIEDDSNTDDNKSNNIYDPKKIKDSKNSFVLDLDIKYKDNNKDKSKISNEYAMNVEYIIEKNNVDFQYSKYINKQLCNIPEDLNLFVKENTLNLSDIDIKISIYLKNIVFTCILNSNLNYKNIIYYLDLLSYNNNSYNNTTKQTLNNNKNEDDDKNTKLEKNDIKKNLNICLNFNNKRFLDLEINFTIVELYILLIENCYEVVISLERLDINLLINEQGLLKNNNSLRIEFLGFSLNFLSNQKFFVKSLVKNLSENNALLVKNKIRNSKIFMHLLNDYKLESSLMKKIGYIEIAYITKISMFVQTNFVLKDYDNIIYKYNNFNKYNAFNNSYKYDSTTENYNKNKKISFNISHIEMSFCKDTLSEFINFVNSLKSKINKYLNLYYNKEHHYNTTNKDLNKENKKEYNKNIKHNKSSIDNTKRIQQYNNNDNEIYLLNNLNLSSNIHNNNNFKIIDSYNEYMLSKEFSKTKDNSKKSLIIHNKERNDIGDNIKLSIYSIKLFFFNGYDYNFNKEYNNFDIEDYINNNYFNMNDETLKRNVSNNLNIINIENDYILKKKYKNNFSNTEIIKKDYNKLLLKKEFPKEIKNNSKDYSNYIILYIQGLKCNVFNKLNSQIILDIGVDVKTFEVIDNIINSKYKKVFSSLDYNLSKINYTNKFLSFRLEVVDSFYENNCNNFNIHNKDHKVTNIIDNNNDCSILNNNNNTVIYDFWISLTLADINILLSQSTFDFVLNFYVYIYENFDISKQFNENEINTVIHYNQNILSDNYFNKIINKSSANISLSAKSNEDILNNKDINTENNSIEFKKNTDTVIICRKINISKFTVNFSYYSQSVKISNLTKKYIEILNLVNLQDLKVEFNTYVSYERIELMKAIIKLINYYVSDIKNNQLSSLVLSLTFAQPFFKFSKGLIDLIRQPYIHYKTDKSIKDGVILGLRNFVAGFTTQSVYLGEKVIYYIFNILFNLYIYIDFSNSSKTSRNK